MMGLDGEQKAEIAVRIGLECMDIETDSPDAALVLSRVGAAARRYTTSVPEIMIAALHFAMAQANDLEGARICVKSIIDSVDEAIASPD